MSLLGGTIGGLAIGGFATGGLATGGCATGGFAAGGFATGDAAGLDPGGIAPGGVAVGGFATGGAAAGGLATGGRAVPGIVAFSSGDPPARVGAVGPSMVPQCPSTQEVREWPSARRKLRVAAPRLRHCHGANVIGNNRCAPIRVPVATGAAESHSTSCRSYRCRRRTWWSGRRRGRSCPGPCASGSR